jgi:hypothetical protein
MSREYVSGIVVGFEFNHEELLEFMKEIDSKIWNKNYFAENEGCNAMIAEDFADEYGFVAKQDDSINKEHVIGLEVENKLCHNDFIIKVEKFSLKIKETLKIERTPKVYSTLITY